ncbi:hypothetical protein [Cellulomonas sp. ATA003]|uniref:hypothetical protein n=1 Tax=Cellulomonas sp. ATA003 TaxID=3073064 RepID=UPI002872E5E7|nr:hypothetical protein [Cellulomonas sp. ATA003]WNB84289.1 hypothetical protein REH70_10315 [Cellulomonas sp. ATA003]
MTTTPGDVTQGTFLRSKQTTTVAIDYSRRTYIRACQSTERVGSDVLTRAYGRSRTSAGQTTSP